MAGALGTASTRNIAGSQLGNLSFAIQDIITVMQYGGGFERAMLAAGNNIGFIATAAGGATGALAGIVATLAIGVIPKLITGGQEASTFREEIDRLADSLERLREYRQITIDIERNFRDANQQRDVFGQNIPIEQQAEKARGVAEQFDKRLQDVQIDRLLEGATGKDITTQIERVRTEILQSFVSQLGEPDIFKPNPILGNFNLDRAKLATLIEAERQGSAISPERERELKNFYSQATLTREEEQKLITDAQAAGRRIPFSVLTQQFPEIVSGDQQKVLDELTTKSQESSDAVRELTAQEQALLAARQGAIDIYKGLSQQEREAKNKQLLRDNELKVQEFREDQQRKRTAEQRKEDERIAREQDQNRKAEVRRSLSQYEQRTNEILRSEGTLLSKLAPDAAQALEIDKLLKPLQNIFGKQNPSAFGEIRSQLLAPKTTDISGQFSVPSFVDQLTNSLLEKDKEPINLSQEAMDLLGKIEEHLRDVEGLGVDGG